jgi:hypothetical protein
MAHFAELGVDNIVQRVIAVNNNELLDGGNNEQESLGVAFCQSLFGGTWMQTSYNGTMRKNFAGVGFTYDSGRNAFIPPKPFASWTLIEETCQWQAPVTMPTDGNRYVWNESTTSWDLVTD